MPDIIDKLSDSAVVEEIISETAASDPIKATGMYLALLKTATPTDDTITFTFGADGVPRAKPTIE